MSFLRYALVTVPLILLLGTISGSIAGAGRNAWFAALEKPAFMPPGWAFGAAWTLLYVLLGLALAMLLHARGARNRGVAIGLFLLVIAATLVWPALFFAYHAVGASLVLIAVMVALTVVLVVLLWWIRRGAALLMLPFLAWLCFAALTLLSIASLNPDAGEVAPRPASTDIVL